MSLWYGHVIVWLAVTTVFSRYRDEKTDREGKGRRQWALAPYIMAMHSPTKWGLCLQCARARAAARPLRGACALGAALSQSRSACSAMCAG